jgi:hypothetical protein
LKTRPTGPPRRVSTYRPQRGFREALAGLSLMELIGLCDATLTAASGRAGKYEPGRRESYADGACHHGGQSSGCADDHNEVIANSTAVYALEPSTLDERGSYLEGLSGARRRGCRRRCSWLCLVWRVARSMARISLHGRALRPCATRPSRHRHRAPPCRGPLSLCPCAWKA